MSSRIVTEPAPGTVPPTIGKPGEKKNGSGAGSGAKSGEPTDADPTGKPALQKVPDLNSPNGTT
jgi:hypothetical protein